MYISLTFPPQILDLEKQLWSAAESGDAEAVQRLIGDGVDVDSQNEVCIIMFEWVMMSF